MIWLIVDFSHANAVKITCVIQTLQNESLTQKKQQVKQSLYISLYNIIFNNRYSFLNIYQEALKD